MANGAFVIANVIKFEGDPSDIIWKHPIENFNTTSQLVVDETHEALFVVNGQAADLFGPGARPLQTGNIPILSKLINLPTGGETPFPCKVFFVRKVHSMNIPWGLQEQEAIAFEDGRYHFLLNMRMSGKMTMSIIDVRKFLLKGAGFVNVMSPDDLQELFCGIIAKYVKKYMAKAVIQCRMSYFEISAHLDEISDLTLEMLRPIFDDYGVSIEFFAITATTIPSAEMEAVSAAKARRAEMDIVGYDWTMERQAEIALAFANNQGTMGAVGGAIGGMMVGGAMGSVVQDVVGEVMGPNWGKKDNAESALFEARQQPVPASPMQDFDISMFDDPLPKQTPQQPASEQYSAGGFCFQCGAPLVPGAAFCSKCGARQAKQCPSCGTPLASDALFCHKCGSKV